MALMSARRSAFVEKGYGLVLLASVAFATSPPLSRLARPAHPVLIACVRVALAASLLAAFDLTGTVRALRALSRVARARVALAGVLLGAHFALFQWGLDQTSLPAAVSLVSLEPLSVVVCAWVFFGIAPRRLERVGVLVATAGAVVIGQGAGEGEHRLLGDALVLGAVVLFGLYVASARALRDVIEARHYVPLVYAAAAITLAVALPFVPTSASATFWPLGAGPIAALCALALVPTAVGHTLVQRGARILSPSLIALTSPGETLGSILISMALFAKSPTLLEAAGCAVILCGALLAIRAQKG
jgi:drug/metabolite transporter (DMT)-like permease